MELSLEKMTKQERRLLLRLEKAEVESKGIIQNIYELTTDDFETIATWCNNGLIEWVANIQASQKIYQVILSDRGWELAQLERRAKAKRTRQKI